MFSITMTNRLSRLALYSSFTTRNIEILIHSGKGVGFLMLKQVVCIVNTVLLRIKVTNEGIYKAIIVKRASFF